MLLCHKSGISHVENDILGYLIDISNLSRTRYVYSIPIFWAVNKAQLAEITFCRSLCNWQSTILEWPGGAEAAPISSSHGHSLDPPAPCIANGAPAQMDPAPVDPALQDPLVPVCEAPPSRGRGPEGQTVDPSQGVLDEPSATLCLAGGFNCWQHSAQNPLIRFQKQHIPETGH